MSRLHQVIQMGEVQEHLHYYIEDYAYTYLKKQKGKEISKYFLYGEREQDSNCEKIYIYGVGEKPKLEQSYFKEYYPVGFLKIKGEKAFWISLKGKEEEITGCFIFYASNQAMQEYLVDHRQEGTEKEPELRKRRQNTEYGLSQKDVVLAARRAGSKLEKEEFRNEKFILPIAGIICTALILVVLCTPNGRKKAQIMKEVIGQTVSEIGISVEDEFVIEEKQISPTVSADNDADDVWQETLSEETVLEQESILQEGQSEKLSDTNSTKEQMQDTPIEKETDSVDVTTTESMDEYIVRDGDTLVGICKIRYGSIAKMQEICDINGIENADYIAPGQKIYLP